MSIDAQTDPRIREKVIELMEAYSTDSEASLYANVAEYFDLAGDARRAIAALRRATELAPDSARLHFLLARALLKAGEFRDGGKALEVCSEIDSVELASQRYYDNNLYYLGYALFNVGRYKEAAEAFRGAQNLVRIWTDPLILKRFHMHQGFAWHLEGQYLEASECYRRAMVAPGPGDSCDEDHMDEDVVEDAQLFNDHVEPFMEMAQQGRALDPDMLEAKPAFP